MANSGFVTFVIGSRQVIRAYRSLGQGSGRRCFTLASGRWRL